MADALVGAWEYDSVEGLEEYMNASGIPEQMKDMARNTKPKMDISKDGDCWVIKTILGDKALENKFPIGQEIETKNIMGKTITSTLTLTSNGLMETQNAGDKTFTVERSAEGNVMFSNMAVDGVEAKAKFLKA